MSHNILGLTLDHYPDLYDKTLLYAIPRAKQREEFGVVINNNLPFVGFDWWNHYEFSWLNNKTGWPEMRVLSFIVPHSSKNIIESKSLKIYLGSFSNSLFSEEDVVSTIEQDLSELLESSIHIQLHLYSSSLFSKIFKTAQGICLDNFPTTCSVFEYDPSLLKLAPSIQQEEASYFKYETHSFRSNCLITQQPDWATIEITWLGKPLLPESLYQYLMSFRLHNAFHEHCIELIFIDLYKIINPKSLTVRGFFNRRGSVDINPCRSMFHETPVFRRYT